MAHEGPANPAPAYAIGPVGIPERNLTVGDALREAASAHPDRIALLEGVGDSSCAKRWTYGELLEDALEIARGLAARYPPG
ncbi:MAG: hypothetical protein LBU38_02720, partial [Propionibacteriaceae bacterium]|nr:hypothetical protein [Propionibacteriaceae bacterium]